MLLDRLDRPLLDLRLSVTDRCNFRCVYCMPKEVFGAAYRFAARSELLTFEEIARVAAVFASLGVEKIRLTGGEPLLRRDIERLVEMLARLGVPDIALTTNGALLTREKAGALRDAGLRRITISLDSLDDAVFRRMNDVDFPVTRVLDAIEVASAAGLHPIKIDVVVKRGENDSEIMPLAEHFRGSGKVVRFIEYMDVGTTNGWKVEDVVPSAAVVAMIGSRWPVEPASRAREGDVAETWRYTDGAGEFGVISSVTQPFCGPCTRVRMSAEGELFTCLFATHGFDLRALVRGGAGEEEIRAAITTVWSGRVDRYSELRSEQAAATRKVEMSRIGG